MKSRYWKIGFVISVSLNIIVGLLIIKEGILEDWQENIASFSKKPTYRLEVLNIKKNKVIEKPIEVIDLPQKINSWNFDGEGWKVFFRDEKGNHPLIYNNHKIGFVTLSPNHTFLGFFFYPKDHSLEDVVLSVLDTNKKTIKEIYRGDTWTSSWEWKGDNAVIVKRKCGTGCMNAYVIDIATGKKIDEYRVY